MEDTKTTEEKGQIHQIQIKFCPIFGVRCCAECTYTNKEGKECPEIKKSEEINFARETAGI